MLLSRLQFAKLLTGRSVVSGPRVWLTNCVQASGRAHQANRSIVPFRASDVPRREIATRVQLSAAAVRAMSAGAPKQIPTPKAQKVKVALCQLAVSPDKDMNIQKAQKAIKEAAQAGAKLVILPEMWNCPYSNESFPKYAEAIEAGNSRSVSAMSDSAKEAGITLVAGSIPESSSGKLYNTCCIFDEQGKLLAKHRKVHLFDIDIPGKITFKESETLTQGESFTVVDTPACRLCRKAVQ